MAMSPADINEHQLVLAQFRANFNVLADAFNVVLTSMQPFVSEYVTMTLALNEMASSVNIVSPALAVVPPLRGVPLNRI